MKIAAAAALLPTLAGATSGANQDASPQAVEAQRSLRGGDLSPTTPRTLRATSCSVGSVREGVEMRIHLAKSGNEDFGFMVKDYCTGQGFPGHHVANFYSNRWTTMNGDKYVPMPRCMGSNPPNCGCDSVNKVDYRGDVSTTASGKKCQAWDAQSPHVPLITPKTAPGRGLKGNYCRNPNFDPNGPWCYTTDEDTRTEYCNIPSCKEEEGMWMTICVPYSKLRIEFFRSHYTVIDPFDDSNTILAGSVDSSTWVDGFDVIVAPTTEAAVYLLESIETNISVGGVNLSSGWGWSCPGN